MKQEEENFEIVKESKDNNKNYLFQKDKITKNTALFIFIVLALLIVATAVTYMFF
ncbi:hypothetical protein [Pseudalgibacter alginicilyticus]|uniref:hypothetical protein n=1 Tax=Pseudalgibacter alginicilyticus TaxID=1736674 RepID=UPI0012FE7DE7|nr:hypothetical protein [Pseudalgibacter alginicilyticus]